LLRDWLVGEAHAYALANGLNSRKR